MTVVSNHNPIKYVAHFVLSEKGEEHKKEHGKSPVSDFRFEVDDRLEIIKCVAKKMSGKDDMVKKVIVEQYVGYGSEDMYIRVEAVLDNEEGSWSFSI